MIEEHSSRISLLHLRLAIVNGELSKFDSRMAGASYGPPRFSGLRSQGARASQARLLEEKERIEKELGELTGVRRWREQQLEFEFMEGTR